MNTAPVKAITLDNGEIVYSSLDIRTNTTLAEIRESFAKLRERPLKFCILVSWQSMINRCTNKNHKSYKNYGGKGIQVCQDWLYDYNNFYDWAITNRYDQQGKQIDRIDVTGNYTPMNCQCITNKENNGRKKYNYFYKDGCQG